MKLIDEEFAQFPYELAIDTWDEQETVLPTDKAKYNPIYHLGQPLYGKVIFSINHILFVPTETIEKDHKFFYSADKKLEFEDLDDEKPDLLTLLVYAKESITESNVLFKKRAKGTPIADRPDFLLPEFDLNTLNKRLELCIDNWDKIRRTGKL
jgi:hypothetical protein